MNHFKSIIATAVLVAAGSAANAQLSYTGGTSAPIVDYTAGPGAEQVDTALFTSGIIDPSFLVGPLGFNVTVTFLGEEAGHLNRLDVGSLSVLNSDVKGTTYGSFFVPAGTLLSGTFTDVTAGVSTPLGGSGGGSASFAILGIGGAYDYIIGFNDAGGDSDYDDLVIGLKISPVPEAGTLAMMFAGLAAIGFVARRRRLD
jgi:hypothetical protein